MLTGVICVYGMHCRVWYSNRCLCCWYNIFVHWIPHRSRCDYATTSITHRRHRILNNYIAHAFRFSMARINIYLYFWITMFPTARPIDVPACVGFLLLLAKFPVRIFVFFSHILFHNTAINYLRCEARRAQREREQYGIIMQMTACVIYALFTFARARINMYTRRRETERDRYGGTESGKGKRLWSPEIRTHGHKSINTSEHTSFLQTLHRHAHVFL